MTSYSVRHVLATSCLRCRGRSWHSSSNVIYVSSSSRNLQTQTLLFGLCQGGQSGCQSGSESSSLLEHNTGWSSNQPTTSGVISPQLVNSVIEMIVVYFFKIKSIVTYVR